MRKWLPFSKADLEEPGQRNVLFISLSQCASAFSYNFINIFLPFYIFKVSPYSQRETLIWVGAIIGVMGICTAITSPIWGSLTHRFSPKILFQRGQIAHAILFLLMGFTMDLHLLFVLRVLQGVFGGVSTIGLILITSSSSQEKIPSNIGLFQSSLTLGQLVGPPLGTLAAATFGYRSSFIFGAGLLLASFLFCQFKVTDVPKLPRQPKLKTGQQLDLNIPHIQGDPLFVPHSAGSNPIGKLSALKGWGLDKRIITGWFVCFMVQIQIIFLPSILPKVLEALDTHGVLALKLAGVVVMCYSIATMLGILIWTRLARKIGLLRLITFLLIMGIIFQALLSFTRGVLDFTFVRMLQTGFVAAVIPLVFTIFATHQKGAVIGFLNASRFSGNAAGPMLAASIMAVSSLNGLCLLISGLTVLALIGFRLVFRSEDSLNSAKITSDAG